MDLIRFAEPVWFVFLGFAALPWVAWWRRPRLVWPTLHGFRSRPGLVGAVPWAILSPLTRSLAITCLVVGLARPQSAGEQIRISGRGLTIALVVDRSSSMRTTDFSTLPGSPPISRLEGAKATLTRFLEARGDDLIGVVAFANLPDTIAPPTLDRRFVWAAIDTLRPAGAGDDGTDLGGAIAWGLDLIRRSPTQRKVLILLTDGHHAPGSAGALDPIVAAEVARGLGVTLHTVAIGRSPRSSVQEPGHHNRPTEITAGPPPVHPPDDAGPDIALLRQLAERGQGRAFVATDADALDAIFEAINSLETSPIEGTIQTVYRECFAPWVQVALVLVAVDLLGSSGRLRRVP